MKKLGITMIVLSMLVIMPGCATIALGVAGGIASFAGKKGAQAEWNWWQREKRCRHLTTQVYRVRCMNRLRAMQGSL